MQRQLRLGDILDDYCPRERRVTNHAIVAMLGAEVKQTRCTTCDAEHEYKQAKVPRQRRKSDTPAALYATVLSGGPKVVTHSQESPLREAAEDELPSHSDQAAPPEPDARQASAAADAPDEARAEAAAEAAAEAGADLDPERDERSDDERVDEEEGPVHRPLIRASLPRTEGQPPPQRQAPDFTIRQPGGGRPGRFRPRHQRGGAPFQSQGNRSNGNGNTAGGPRHGGGGRPPQGGAMSRLSRRNGPGRKRSK